MNQYFCIYYRYRERRGEVEQSSIMHADYLLCIVCIANVFNARLVIHVNFFIQKFF